MQFFHYYMLKCNILLTANRMAEKKYCIVEFEDGLQVIPKNWLNADSKKAFWPHYTNNKRYDKAVRLMEKPESTWFQHPIRKMYGMFCK